MEEKQAKQGEGRKGDGKAGKDPAEQKQKGGTVSVSDKGKDAGKPDQKSDQKQTQKPSQKDQKNQKNQKDQRDQKDLKSIPKPVQKAASSGDTGRPASDKSASGKSASGKPAPDKPASGKPTSGKSASEKSASDKSAASAAAFSVGKGVDPKSAKAVEEKKGGSAFLTVLSVCIILLFIGCIAVALYLYRDTIRRRDQWNADRQAALRESKAQEREAAGEEATGQEEPASVPSMEEAGFFQKLREGLPVHILVVGDAFATGAGASSQEEGWPSLFLQKLREEYGVEATLSNLSLMGGNTAYSGYVLLHNVPEEEAPDLCIVSYGYYDDVFTYALYYEALLRALDARFPGCSLISVIESAAVTHMEGNADETAMYTRRMCEHYHGIVANMAEAYADEARPYEELSDEYALPNDAGQEIYAEWLLRTIQPEAEAYAPKREAQPDPMDPNVLSFDGYTYVPAEAFQQVDAFNYRIRRGDLEKLGAPQSGLLGLDYEYQPGRNNVNVRIDGESFAGHVEEFEGDSPERHIRVMGNHAVVSEDLIIGFEDAAQAAGFHGIALSGDIVLNEDKEEVEELPIPEIPEELEDTEEAEEAEDPEEAESAEDAED